MYWPKLSSKKCELFSLYIPSLQSFFQQELCNLFSTRFLSLIVTPQRYNFRDIVLQNSLIQTNICVLSEEKSTHLSAYHTFSHADLTCCSPSVFPSISWCISDDLNSDHFLLVINVKLRNASGTPLTLIRDLLDKPHWTNYSKQSEEILNNNSFNGNCNHYVAITL